MNYLYIIVQIKKINKIEIDLNALLWKDDTKDKI